MAINLTDEGNFTSYPVIRQQRIGEQATLAIIRHETRDRLAKNPITKELEKIPNGVDRNGKPKYKKELVIHCITMPNTDMEAKLGGEGGVPQVGERVKVILKAKGFGNWIEARKSHRQGKLNVGDVLKITTDHAQQFDENGAPKGQKITTQAEVDKIHRGITVGFYGSISLAEPGTEDDKWIAAAEAAWRDDDRAKRAEAAIPAGAPVQEEEEVW